MSTTLASILVLLASVGSPVANAAPAFPCVMQFGAQDRQLLYSVSSDSQGNFAVAGGFSGTVDFGGGTLTSRGERDMFVAKFDSRCRHLWSRQFGSPAEELVVQVHFDSYDNLVIAGNVRGAVDFGGGLLETAGDHDVVLAKLAPDGSHIWSKRFGDSEFQRVEGIDLDAGDNIAIAGSFAGSLDFGLGPLSGQVYVARLDPSGAPIFNRAFSSTESDFQFRAVATDPDGNVAVAGIFRGAVTLGGDSFSFAGKTAFGYGIILGKFAPDGTYLWSAAYPTRGEALAFGPNGTLFLWTDLPEGQQWALQGVTLTGPRSVIIVPDGGDPPKLWKAFPAGVQAASGSPTIVVDDRGIVSLAATLTSTADVGGGPLVSAGSYDILVARFDQYGNHLYSSVHGDKRPQFIATVAPTTDGHLIVAGSFSGAITFGDVTLLDSDGSGTAPGTVQTAEDIFVVTLDSESAASPAATVPAASPLMLAALGVGLIFVAWRCLRP